MHFLMEILMNPSHSGAFSVTGYEFHFKCADVSILKLPAKAQECIPQYLTCTDPNAPSPSAPNYC